MVEGGNPLAAGGLGQGAGEPCIADSGCAGNQEIVVSPDPLAGGKVCQQRVVDGASGFGIQVFQGGILPQSGTLEPAGKLAVLPLQELRVHEQSQAVF